MFAAGTASSLMMMPGSTEFALAQTDNSTSTRPPRSSLAKVFTTQAPYLKSAIGRLRSARYAPRRGNGLHIMKGNKNLSRPKLHSLWRIVCRKARCAELFICSESEERESATFLRDPGSPTWDDCARDSLALFCPQVFVEGLDAYWVGLADDCHGNGLDNCRAGTAITPADAVAGECKNRSWLRTLDNWERLLRLGLRRRGSSPAQGRCDLP